MVTAPTPSNSLPKTVEEAAALIGAALDEKAKEYSEALALADAAWSSRHSDSMSSTGIADLRRAAELLSEHAGLARAYELLTGQKWPSLPGEGS